MPKRSNPPDSQPREHRFAFARRWEKKKKARSLRRAWAIMVLDVALLALISILALMLVRRLT